MREPELNEEEQLRQAVTAIWKRRRRVVMRRVAAIDECINQIERGETDARTLSEARVESHRLAGALGSLGFPGASRAAGTIEDLLGSASPAESISQLVEAMAALQKELAGRRDPDPA